jgi:GNAT superfamily N-acetyltransferase
MAPSDPASLGERGRRPLVGELQIRPLPAGDDDAVSAVVRMINEVYAGAEKGLWADGASRTSAAEVAGLVRDGELVAAWLDGRLVGCVRVRRVDDETSEFGMLAADSRHRGVGVGRELVAFAERWSRDAGRDTMRLELLVPREWAHPDKEFLAAWYGRLGYRVIGASAVEDSHPDLAPLLATPCDFLVYQKDLRG